MSIIQQALQAYLELAQHMHDEVCQSYQGDVMLAKQAMAALSQEAEPVEKTFGEGIDVSYQDLFSQWQAEHELQLKTEKPAPLPQPVASKKPQQETVSVDRIALETLIESMRFCAAPYRSGDAEELQRLIDDAARHEPVASVPQDVEEFIAANRIEMLTDYPYCEVVETEDLRAWMAGHARVETRNVRKVEMSGDQSVQITFASCRSASAFMKAVSASQQEGV